MAYYDWLKALHVIAVIAWMAGIFYLPRLFVYHSRAAVGSAESETFKVMERKLLRLIMNPAMIVTWVAGLAIAYLGGWTQQGWFVAKFILVIAMSAFHMWLSAKRRAFEADRNQLSERTYRLANEIPTILMILIVILVVVKPF
ncbi:protoporphyrinogen oxidase HemJ [Kaistia dalseonensis]|uniref:Protoporphyrinogen IX oxidase n=1 Tax=Kaistia dalseonensis TaxID=410840 RepID=A0ABU0H535_9HYPH|nr:protoporphyrinogen oxidase HemJ [Kaistia dalseonensis]MCX5494838.1 protoporphyrinogen oxidase HemJ [Kaistia dalseonensis]MDQ0437419.1 putative membrane protein [Kaistia dalseonensis]